MFQRIPRWPQATGVHACHLIPRLSARSLNNKGLLLQTESAGHGPALPKVTRGGIAGPCPASA